jgi:23S rRNA (adenine2503-C2)-methyltransferase
VRPWTRDYPLADILAECLRYSELRGRKVFVECVMLAGVDDRVEAGGAARPRPRRQDLQPEPDPVQADGRVRRLVTRSDRRIQGSARPGRDRATVRLTRGRDIDAARGQLAAGRVELLPAQP